MIRRPYKLAGNDVPASLRGQVVNVRVAETIDEATSMAGGDVTNVIAAFNDSQIIRLQGQLRSASKKKALPELQALADGFTYAQRGESQPREVKPKTQQARQAESVGNKLFELCEKDPTQLARMVKLGVVDQTAFDTWKAARDAATAATTAQPTA